MHAYHAIEIQVDGWADETRSSMSTLAVWKRSSKSEGGDVQGVPAKGDQDGSGLGFKLDLLHIASSASITGLKTGLPRSFVDPVQYMGSMVDDGPCDRIRDGLLKI